MNKNDFITRAAVYADGFEVSSDEMGMTVIVTGELVINNSFDTFREEVKVDHYLFDLIYYPLLLQRAMEGWNFERGVPGDMFIAVLTECLTFYEEGKRSAAFYFNEYGSTEKAKRALLEWIFEQEE